MRSLLLVWIAMDDVRLASSKRATVNPLRSMLDLLEDFMELRGIPYARLDGGTTRPRRTLDIKLVRVSHTARYFVLMLHLSFNKRNRVRVFPTFVFPSLSVSCDT